MMLSQVEIVILENLVPGGMPIANFRSYGNLLRMKWCLPIEIKKPFIA
jgi:hypothetical protein